MKTILLSVLPLLIAWIQLESGQAQPLPHAERLTDRQGLPQAFVPAIVQDRRGFIWMATRDGLARYDGTHFKVFQPDPDGRPSLTSADVAQIKQDHYGKLWIANEQGSLDVFDPVTEQFTNLAQRPAFKQLQAKSNQLSRFCLDRQDRLWITLPQGGLMCMNWKTSRFETFSHQPSQAHSLSHNAIVGVLDGPGGKIWVLTEAGLDCFDEATHGFRHYLPQLKSATGPKSLWVRPSGDVVVTTDERLYRLRPASNEVRQYVFPASVQRAAYTHFAEDRRGRVFLARDNKLFVFDEKTGIRLLDVSPNQQQHTYQAAVVDQSDVLWLGTAGAGVRKFDLRTLPFQTAPYQVDFVHDLFNRGWLGPLSRPSPSALNGLSSYNFRATFDTQGRMWYNVGSSEFSRLDVRTGQHEPVPFPIRFRNPDIGVRPCPLATDPTGRVWAVYDTTAYWYDENQARWNRFRFGLPRQPGSEHQMLVVDGQALWIATSAGGLLRVDRVSGRIRRYVHVRHNPASLSSNALLSLAADPDDPDRLWIGTFGSGLCRFSKKTGTVQRLSVADGLPNNVIYSVIPDRHGDLWIGTNKGIGRIDRRTLAVEQIYTTEDGILADEFNRFHFLYLPADDRILMGGLEGITAFYPAQIRPDSFQPRVELTTLAINNQPVLPGPASPLGERPVQAIDELRLPHNQNFLTVGFAALQFNRPEKNRYRYQLVGLNPTWVESRRGEAVFTGLPPGTYTLRLNATNVSGIWSPHVRTLSVVISPPWWATGWAYALYAVLVAGVGYALFRSYANRLRLQQSVRLKEGEAGQLRELNAMKTRFFANLTHELRTPLTLILSPAGQLMNEPLDAPVRRGLTTIYQNASQLLRLINQLLDLSRLEVGVMPLHESVGDPARCVEAWLQPLTEQAVAQGLSLSFDSTVRGEYWFDPEKFERIVYNLTANALKFTPAGSIRVALTDAAPDGSEGFVLTVADTGIGIPADQLPRIFDRFYQVGSGATSDADHTGTGIGLSLVNELVLLQGGRITVDSEVGKGTTFVVQLPYRKAGPANREVPRAVGPDELTARLPVADEADEPIILIVEDHDELAGFIADSLPTTYRVSRAVDGQAGLEQALAMMPDLVISDVMMPRMDGFTLCGRLKTDLRTGHIPVMLLTAKVEVENRLEGLSQGADDYLTKPFHVAELLLRVRNLLESRRQQREWIRRSLASPESAQSEPQPTDPFLVRLYAVLDANLSDPTLSVERLLSELAMSRTNLHRKIKSLTGLSTSELIRNYRLKVATSLLRQGYNSSETARQVGFESLSYFAKCFRELYGVTPTEFVRASPQ